MKNKERILFFLYVLIGTSALSFGQKTVTEVYRIDKEQAVKIAIKIANEYMPDDKINQANYQAALEEAFNLYLRYEQVKYLWRNDTIELLNKELDSLNQSLSFSKGELIKLINDTLPEKNIILGNLQQKVDELLERISKMKADSLAAKKMLDKSQDYLVARKEDLEHELDSLTKEYSAVCMKSNELKKTRERLDQENMQMNKASAKISDQKKVHAAFQSKLESVIASLRSINLVDFNGKKYLSLIEEYSELKGQIKVLSPELEGEIDGKASQLKNYIQLSDVLKEAIGQMGGKYVEKTNNQFVEKLLVYKEKLESYLTDEQVKVLNTICKELKNQKYAYSHFCDMLNELQEEYVCIVDNAERQRIQKDGFFSKQIERFAYGTRQNPPYSSYYKLLNDAFVNLQKDLEVNSQTLSDESVNTEEKFKKYLNRIKSSL